VPLDVVTDRPRNAETPWVGLLPSQTPSESFFVRNHFDEPSLDPGTYHLRVVGEVAKAKLLTLAQLHKLPAQRISSVLECAGNGRTRMVPTAPGVPWGERAVGCATWEGPALSDVLHDVVPEEGVLEAVFRGADLGIHAGIVAHYERSLPWTMATSPGPLLALRMNGEPLPRSHGAPVRLLVPGWYGMASVKWLTDIRLTSKPFTGYFQKDQYVWDDASPVRELRPKAMLLRPSAGEPLRAGPLLLEGKAWGHRGVQEVQAQVDGTAWQACSLGRDEGPWAWRSWSLSVDLSAGEHTVRVRARDAQGEWQPLEPVTNRGGYGYNTAPMIRLRVMP
jgi:DMSO/TMAO reductase YedYZ molybdopterin-dependent catalytic subunit